MTGDLVMKVASNTYVCVEYIDSKKVTNHQKQQNTNHYS